MSANLAPPGAIENEPREKLDVEEILHPQEKPDTEKTYEFQDLLIGAVLRKLRGSMSLREVERQTGIANPYLSSLELGAKRPGFKVLIQLALFYGGPCELPPGTRWAEESPGTGTIGGGSRRHRAELPIHTG